MNTISSVRPYVGLRNNPQTPTTQPQQPQNPSFRGAIGKRVVQDIAAKKPLTIAAILALVGGVIGLSKDKVSDVMEEMVGEIKSLQGKNESLNKELTDTKAEYARKEEKARAEYATETKRLRDSFSDTLKEKEAVIAEKDALIAKKDAKIRELKKYEAFANVRSLEEIGVVMPDQVSAIIKEIGENIVKAGESAVDFMLTGKGQEEFTKQMERYQIMQNAIFDGMLEIPTLKDEVQKLNNDTGLVVCGSAINAAINTIEAALCSNEKGSYLESTSLYSQGKDNLKALLAPYSQNSSGLDTSIDDMLGKVRRYHRSLLSGMLTMRRKGYTYIKTVKDDKCPKPTHTKAIFKYEPNGKFYEITYSDMANQRVGSTHEYNPEDVES